MRHSKTLVRLAGLIAALLCVGVAAAQISTNFNLGWHVLSSSGGTQSSPAYRVRYTVDQTAVGTTSSANAKIAAGFWYGVPVGPPPVPGDAFEVDDTCAQAKGIAIDGTAQTHNFHRTGDQDWVKFTGQAGKSYLIATANPGAHSDGVVFLYDTCAAAPLASLDDAFASTVSLEWDCTQTKTYYLKFMQHDPAVFGTDTGYNVSVTVDNVPPARPGSLRAAAGNGKLIVQWQKNTEPDAAGYHVWTGTTPGLYGRVDEVTPASPDTTYYELGNLSNGTPYYLALSAYDFSGNESQNSLEISAVPTQPLDLTSPSIAVQSPSAAAVYTTTQSSITIGGTASDSGGNLSRVQVKNLTRNVEGWDYSLSGGSASFHVQDIPLQTGPNQVQALVYDGAGNSSSTTVTIRKLGATQGAVVIAAGHNQSYSVQANIDYSANRTYRVFQAAGYTDDDIYYLSSTGQDLDGDGVDEVDAPATGTNLQNAIQTWAAAKVGPGKPFYVYLMDHGNVEGFCTDGCVAGGGATGPTSPKDLDTWLSALETATGADQVNVIIEACHSGSFIDRDVDITQSISKAGRVIVSSTDRLHNAYASPQGAYFSDAFFSCAAASQNLKSCFTQGVAAVSAGSASQAPWLDDNGDGLATAADGTYADDRYIGQFFGGQGPIINTTSVSVAGGNGVLSAQILRGDEEVALVWATVYPPSYQEPTGTTTDLGVPILRLQADPQTAGRYTVNYPQGFTESGDYRVVFYAQDTAGNSATPKVAQAGKVYLPLVRR